MNLARRRLLRVAGFGSLAIGGSALWVLVEQLRSPKHPLFTLSAINPGTAVPPFALPGLGNDPGFTSDDLRAGSKPVLVNFFASWCAPCVQELPTLMALRRQPVAVWGIAYRDQPDATAAFLRDHGNPYARVAQDQAGTVSIRFGLAGVPESFLIDQHGIIRWHWRGGMSAETVRRFLVPALDSAV